MTTAIVSILLVYLALSLMLGIWAKKRSLNTSDDYFLAGRSVSWFHLALTMFATWFSTFAFLGGPGFFYKKGVNWFLAQGSFLLIAPLLSWFIGRKIWLLGRARGYITPGDMLADFYQSEMVRTLVAVICFLALIPYSLIQFVGIGKVIASSTGGAVPYAIGVLLAMIATAFYTFVGGIRAIIWTDILQGVLFLSVIGLGAGVAIYVAGGIDQGYATAITVRPEAFVLDMENVGSTLTFVIIWSFGFVLLPHLWQRSYMAKSALTLSKGIVLFSVLSLLLVMGTMLMGTLSIGFMPQLADSDIFVTTLYNQYIPWALPLLVLATFAAGMSTIDSQLLTASSVVVRDISKPLFGKKLSSERERKLGRLVVLGLIILLGLMALFPESQGAIIPLASKGTSIALLLLVPLCGPLLWDRSSRKGAISSMIVGGSILFLLETGLVAISLPFGFGAAVLALLVQAGVFVGVSLLSKKEVRSYSPDQEAAKYLSLEATDTKHRAQIGE